MSRYKDMKRMREYDRLASLLPSAIREAAAHMEAEGFMNAPEIAQKILEL